MLWGASALVGRRVILVARQMQLEWEGCVYKGIYEPIPLIIFVLKSLSLLRTENEKSRFSSTFSEKK